MAHYQKTTGGKPKVYLGIPLSLIPCTRRTIPLSSLTSRWCVKQSCLTFITHAGAAPEHHLADAELKPPMLVTLLSVILWLTSWAQAWYG